MSLTVREILSLEGLEGMRVRAGRHSLTNPVRWYYVAENSDISHWIMGGELVFITGVNKIWDVDSLLSLVSEAKKNNAAGVVVLTGGKGIPHIPLDVVTLSEELNLPLIEQPYDLKMVLVTEKIGSAMIKWDDLLKSKQNIIHQLIKGDPSGDEINRLRASHQSMNLNQPVYLILFNFVGINELFKSCPAEIAENILRKAKFSFLRKLTVLINSKGIDFPVTEVDGFFSVLVPGEKEAYHDFKSQINEIISSEIKEEDYPFKIHCGVSSLIHEGKGHRKAFSQARQAIENVSGNLGAVNICEYSELGFIKIISEIKNQELLKEFMHETLGSLISYGKKNPYLLIETLEVYYRENLNIVKTAQALGLHRNTLNQRIRKIEAITGHPADHPQFHLNASIGLLIWRMKILN